MKTTTIAAILIATTVSAFSQGGPLTPPPGAPAPTMKTLDQVEPRIPLVAGAPGVTIAPSGQVTISQSGSYYLTNNIEINTSATGIRIEASGVTVDLMGYSIIAPASGNADDGIEIEADQVTIRNGHIVSGTTFDGTLFTQSGFGWGVFANSTRNQISISNLSVKGTRFRGIQLLGSDTEVRNCTVFISGSGGGIRADQVCDSVARVTGGTSIEGSLVEGCIASCVGNNPGISASIVNRSKASSTGSHGISATISVSESEGVSTATASDRDGIICAQGTVSNSRGTSTSRHGISARIISHSSGNSTNGTAGRGIQATEIAVGSSGHSAGSHGVFSNGVVNACYGSTTHASTGSHGIRGERMVSNSVGFSSGTALGSGISSAMVSDSYGQAISTGLHGIAAWLVTHSYGFGGAAGTSYGISATHAVGCRSVNGESITHKYNMP